MNALVVHAHPDSSSFSHALVRRAESGLRRAGHAVTVLDLYAIDFRATLSRAEHAADATNSPVLDPLIAAHAQLVQDAHIIVFVYPTWWSSLPAILKAWFERTLVRGVAFHLDSTTGKITPLLTTVRHIVGITTYGSPWWYVKLINDNGRRTIQRALRLNTTGRVRLTWMGMYSLDSSSASARSKFLDRVESTMASISS